MKLQLYTDQSGDFHWRLRGSNGLDIAESLKGFSSKRNCLDNLSSTYHGLIANRQRGDQAWSYEFSS